jgi:SPP1 gp7 family putative phage head morphogenesis protein
VADRVSARAERVAREVALRLSLGDRRRRRKRLPRQNFPAGIARDYRRRVAAVYAASIAGLAPLREELPRLLASARAERFDAGEGDRIRRLVEAASRAAELATEPTAVERLAREFALKTSTHQRRQLAKQTRAALGVDVFADERGVSALIDSWAAENAALIRSVSQRVIDEVALASTRAVSAGTLWPDLAKEIEGRVGLGEKRSRLIARDQVGKLYGQVNAQRQRNLGVEHFIWRTVNDQRVRPRHAAIEGERFPLDGGHPAEGLPGQPVLCRCYSEPDFSAILGETDPGELPTYEQVARGDVTREIPGRDIKPRRFTDPTTDRPLDPRRLEKERLESVRELYREERQNQGRGVIVAVRPDNTHEVIDGRHRIAVAPEFPTLILRILFVEGV